MLKIYIPERELYDERTNTFYSTKSTTLELEHSLVSLSKWESKWHKAFLSNKDKTTEETLDYIRCMSLNPNTDLNVIYNLTNKDIATINEYIDNKMTATYIYDRADVKGRNEVITSELIYYWMITLNIPFECQKWHLNRLMTLIRVCDIKNNPPKSMSQKELMSRNRALNEARKQKLNTKG